MLFRCDAGDFLLFELSRIGDDEMELVLCLVWTSSGKCVRFSLIGR